MKKLFLVFFLFLTSFGMWGQEENQHWSEMMLDPNVNFYDVQQSFEQDWADREIEKGKGFKQFKRWEWFMEPRVYPSGDRFSSMASWDALSDERRNMPQGERMNGVWSYFGNTDVPTSGGGAGRINMVRTDPNNDNVYFACAPGGGLWRSDNAGASWSLLNTDLLASIGVTDVAIDYTNSNVIYIATGDGDAGDTYSLGVLKSEDGGSSWSSTGLNWDVTQTRRINRMIMHPTDNNLLIAATSNGVYKTTDGGATWNQTLSGNYKDIEWKPGTPATVYVVGNNDEFYRSSNTGDTWTAFTSGLPNSGVSRFAMAVSPNAPNTVYIVAGRSSDQGFLGFYRSLDSGTTWSTMATSPNLLGWSDTGSDGGGQAWYDLAIAADPNDANTVYVGGVNVWKTTDGGSNWSCSGHWYGANGIPYVHADNHGFNFIPGTSTLLIGCDGGVFRTTNGGNSYTDLSNNLEVAQIYRLGTAQTNQNIVISGWQDNGTNLKDGANWTRVIGGDGFESAVDYTNDNIMYGALYYGAIFKSTNGGGSFNQIIASNGGGVDEGGAWLTPYILDPNNPNTMYVGKSTVYRSTDGGASFTTLGAIPGGNINGLAVAKSNSNYIYCSKGSTLYRSTDGTNFSQLNGLPNLYITYIAVDPADENRVWVTLSGYSNNNKVYFSDNGGSSWTNVSTGLPNIPANCITYHEGTNDALYVGTDAGVYYRDASFGSWQPYKDGLPNVVVTELEVHSASNTIVASTYGRGIWHAPLFTLPAIDAGIVEIVSPSGTQCDTGILAEITVGCFGSDNITALTIEYGIQGGTVNTYNWTGDLATGQVETITLPSYDEGAGSFVFEASITEVNGNVGDESAINNLSSSSYFVTGGTNDLTLTLSTDCWGNETSWTITDGLGTEIYSGAGYGSQDTFIIPLCLGDDCYTFTIYDSYGDGVAGTLYGCGIDGNYAIEDDQGNVLVAMDNANFGAQADHLFCLGATNPGCDDPTACNYDAAADANDGSCVFPGCTNALACNYDATAGCDDGSCILPDGCTLPEACNYDSAALCDDGSCILPDGCTDATACNYDANALCNDGNCIYPPEGFDCDCNQVLTANFPSLTGGQQDQVTFDAAGDALGVDIALDWVNLGPDGSWAGDVAMALIAPDGTCIEWGGYNTFIGCTSLGNYGIFPGDWQSTTSGFYTAYIDLSSTGLSGAGTWTFIVMNGYGASQGGSYDLTLTFNGMCLEDLSQGCTDPTACNYDPTATVDDGSCDLYSCIGCTDPTACNYDPEALIQGVCLFFDECGNCGGTQFSGCTDTAACNFDLSASCDDGSCEYLSCAGCTDATACNYDATATIDDGSCLQLDECGNCGGNATAGCTDAGACNYDAMASCDDGSCEYLSCAGCTDATACNYDATATIDDGSCLQLDECGNCGGNATAGCMDAAACNYDAMASCDDESCEYLSCAGCTDATACNYDATATIDDGYCLQLDECGNCGGNATAGCMDAAACNYDAMASCDDGSCEYLSCAGCTDATACNYDATATIDDGSCLQLDECGNCGGNATAGCTDAGACNYNAMASCDDGSCEYLSCAGCTDTTACNYDVTATIDNGSCTSPIMYYVDSDGDGFGDDNIPGTESCSPMAGFAIQAGDCDDTRNDVHPDAEGTAEGIDNNCDGIISETEEVAACMGDLNEDGNRDVADLLLLLQDYGCQGVCIADMSNDGAVDTADMLAFLSVYGTPCN